MHSAGQITDGVLPRTEAIAAALDWWREAGVDWDYDDEARLWLAEPQADVAAQAIVAPVPTRPAPPATATSAPLGGARDSWPQSLDEFRQWWMAEPSLDEGRIADRVAPRGTAAPALMILVEQPEAEDEARLLSGPQGRMLGQILAALELAEEQVYLASALPRHMPLPDWQSLAASGLDALTTHHLALVKPQRVLVFGSNVSSLLGHGPANSDGFLPGIHHDGPRFPALVAPALSALAARPRGKARLWQALLDWTGGDGLGTDKA